MIYIYYVSSWELPTHIRHVSKVRRGTFNIREKLPRQTKFWICVYVPTLPRGKVVKVNLPRRTFET